MKYTTCKRRVNTAGSPSREGVILMVVLVLLVVLSTLGYMISSRVIAQRHRQQYIIDYQTAQYARDSAIKYALSLVDDMNEPQLVERADMPDFSDTFLLSDSQLREIISRWAEHITSEQVTQYMKWNRVKPAYDINSIPDINDANLMDSGLLTAGPVDVNVLEIDPNNLNIPGPYGPRWPLVTPPIEIEIGGSKVVIEIHDENAKYPLGWAMLDDIKIRREASASFKTFCEWMGIDDSTTVQLEKQLAELGSIKRYKLKFEDIKQVKRETIKVPSRPVRPGRTRRSRMVTRVKTTVTTIPATVHITDFAMLFNSPIINTEILAKPTIISDNRKESALKYISLWGADKVNINSAPRQVLEAVFTFGGDAPQIAQEIIERRRVKPFEDIDELRRALFRHSDSIDKCKDFITTRSDMFTIRVTAIRGVAKTTAVMAVKRTQDKKYELVAALTG